MKKVFLAILIMATSCGTGRIVTTETKTNETIVFGKLNVISENPLENKKLLMHFNERLWAKNAVWLDEQGYFYMKMPLGKNFIALLEYRDGNGYYKNIPDNYLSIDVLSTENVYCIGDINITWTPDKSDKRKSGGVAGVVGESKKEGEKLPVIVEKSDATIDYFKQKFPNNKKEIVLSLVTIDK
ncbi:MAG: hypothetical protein LBS55_08550, partial [Prevotellaceae bacterium]|jgi:hypothetical protein|nr:hypothetical protein [Prevotellaceae bacterium]